MGNKIGRRRQVVDEKYTRPQGLYKHRDIDEKKLRKLILKSKLAPCYPGDEEFALDLEECPICFLYYPSLNRSNCCMKSICTECFLQMKRPHSSPPTQCPFCKTPNYAVEYRGVKSKEEKNMEQVEEQKVIEAQIRMRQQELQDEEERVKRNQMKSSCRMTPAEVEYQDMYCTSFSVPSFQHTAQGSQFASCQPSCPAPASTRPSHSRHNWGDNIDVDLEEIMFMEAIWLSIQEQGNAGNPSHGSSMFVDPPSPEHYDFDAENPVQISPGGYACAVASPAMHNDMSTDYSSVASYNAPVFETIQQTDSRPEVGSWIEVSSNYQRGVGGEGGECSTDQWFNVAGAGTTSHAGSDIMLDAGAPSHFQLLPESIEEQMMLSMAVSLAEARGRTNAARLAWL